MISAGIPPSPAFRATKPGSGRLRGVQVLVTAALYRGLTTLLGLPGTPAQAGEADFPPPAPTAYSLALPANGTRTLRIISPTLLELEAVTAGSSVVPGDKTPTPPVPPPELAPQDFKVMHAGRPLEVTRLGFRRRVVYAPLRQRDLRIGNFVYLQLAAPLPEKATVELSYAGPVPWLAGLTAKAGAEPDRLSPAIHVNQVGYASTGAKQAMVGYYLGTLGEMPAESATEFLLVALRTGEVVHRGPLTPRPDRDMPFRWYQQVRVADFTGFETPGEYRVVVPGLGASYPFFIDAGIPAGFARTYALGLYHQRCGAANALPFTRFVHEACHTAPAEVPTVPVTTLLGFPSEPADLDLYPYARQGKVDVSGGHHDAGDYSKYTINSTGLVHHLVFAVDSFPGVAELDNLGLPESGDGHSDLLQIAKWEADFLARMQDDDGGFYFLVYPKARKYEQDVLPDQGDLQIVWPRNTAVTAAAVATLAQCASSPRFRESYPKDAARYLAAARRGWTFLRAAQEKFGADNTYRKFTHYGDEFKDADEMTWAACELFLATGEPEFDRELHARLNPRDPETRRWGWRRMVEGYGRAIRSYAFAVRSGRVTADKLDRQLLLHCEAEIVACADDWLQASRDSAYGTSYPTPTKRVIGGGWYFPLDQAFDLAVACQLDFPVRRDPRAAYRAAIIGNINYEAGTNPVNVSFLTGVGWKRPLEIVHQYAQNDRRVLPPSGIPLGTIQDGFGWMDPYKGELGALCYPLDGAKSDPYPILDRWGDSFNLQTEFVIVNQARALATAAWLMAETPLRTQRWKPDATLEITGLPAQPGAGRSFTLALRPPAGMDLSTARIVWEARDHVPAYGAEFEFRPAASGPSWVEVEAQWPDGRRLFGTAEIGAAVR